jgi:DNA-directed RNA polymerase specialized sigma24 family protein
VKDLLKRRRDDNLMIEDMRARSVVDGAGSDYFTSGFDARYLSSEEEEAFAEVLDDDVLIPSTLSEDERKVLVCMYLEYTQADMADKLSLSRKEVATAVKNIRIKMEDWRPTPVPVEQPVRVAA